MQLPRRRLTYDVNCNVRDYSRFFRE